MFASFALMALDTDTIDLTSGKKQDPKNQKTGTEDISDKATSPCMKPDFTALELWRSQAAERKIGDSSGDVIWHPNPKVNSCLAERLRNVNKQDAMNTLPSPIDCDEEVRTVDNIPSGHLLSVIDEVSSQVYTPDLCSENVISENKLRSNEGIESNGTQNVHNNASHPLEENGALSEKEDTITPKFSSYQDRIMAPKPDCRPCERCSLFTTKIHDLKKSLDNMTNSEKCTNFVTLWRFIKALVKDRSQPAEVMEVCKVCDLCNGVCNSYHQYVGSHFNFRFRMSIREDFAKIVQSLDPNTTVVLNSSVCSVNANNDTNSVNKTPNKRLTIIPEPQPYKVPSSELETTTSDSSALDTSADINTIPIYETASKIDTSSNSRFSGLMEEINKVINKEVQCLKEDITNRIINSITPAQNDELNKKAKDSNASKQRKDPSSPLIFGSSLYPAQILPLTSPSRPTKYDLLKQLPVADANRPYRLDHPLSNMNASPYPTSKGQQLPQTAKSTEKNDDTHSNLTVPTKYENIEVKTFDCKLNNVIASVKKTANRNDITDASTQCDASLDSFSNANASTETEQTMSLCCVCKQWDPIELSSASCQSVSEDPGDGSDDSGARTDFTCHTAVVPRKLVSKTKSKLTNPKKIKLDLPRTLTKNSSTTFLMKDNDAITPTMISNKSKSSVITRSSVKGNDKNNKLSRSLPKPTTRKANNIESPLKQKTNNKGTSIYHGKTQVTQHSNKLNKSKVINVEKKNIAPNSAKPKQNKSVLSPQIPTTKNKPSIQRALKVKVPPESNVTKPPKNTSNLNLKQKTISAKEKKPRSQIAVIKPTLQNRKTPVVNQTSPQHSASKPSFKLGTSGYPSNYIKNVRQNESKTKHTEEWVRKITDKKSNSSSKNHNSHGTDSGVCLSSKNTATQPSSVGDKSSKLKPVRAAPGKSVEQCKTQKCFIEKEKLQKSTSLLILKQNTKNDSKKGISSANVKVSFPKSSYTSKRGLK